MEKERISSQEIADYTNINATQIRRDLSAFGKFGKRGVGYNIDSLLGEIRKILRTQGQHNIALIGAGRLGEAIASSPIFAEHGINVAAVFDTDPDKVGRHVGHVEVSPYEYLPQAVHDKNIIVGVLAVPAGERTACRRRPDRRRREDHLQLLGGAARRPVGRRRAHVEPCGRAPLRPLLPPDLRILLWHGYLLGGTGSNVYTRALAREWTRAGHEVVVFSQERYPELYDLGGAEHVRPDIGGVLPVFVLDRYEGLEARLVQDLTPEERDRYVELNATALRERLPADVVFANHVVLGGPVAAATGVRFRVKAHGSELEYSMRGNEELSAWARDALARADAVFVGSAHIRQVLEDVVGQVGRVVEVPPGVDVDAFRPVPHDEAFAQLLEEARRDPPNIGNANERLPDEGNAERFAEFFARPEPTVVYFGKLIYNKGVHLLLEALNDLDAKAVIVGFGDYRSELEALGSERTLFTGALEHRHLAALLPLCDVAVVPSIFPEAFGMVAAEAAAAGVTPLVARHSGLAEVAAGLEAEYPPERAPLTSFSNGDVAELRDKLAALLALPADERAALGEAARRAAVTRWSWASVAERLLAPVT